MLDVAYAGRHLLLTGDLEQLGLVELVARPRPEPPPDVFLAPHHGGRTANPEWLYEWAKPRLVVVSQRPVDPRDQRRPVRRSNAEEFPSSEPGERARSACDGRDDGIAARGFLDETSDQGDERGPVRETASSLAPSGRLAT